MMQDIERIATEPTDEDRHWFPDIAGNGDAYGTLREIWANYRDESFVSQYLSPHVHPQVRPLPAWSMTTTRRRWKSPPSTTSAAIAKCAARSRGSTTSRAAIPTSRSSTSISPATAGSICATASLDGVTLEEKDADRVLQHVADLWGYEVRLIESDDETVYAEHKAEPMRPFA